MRVILCLALLVVLSSAQDKGVWRELATLDCNGNMHITSSSFDSVVNFPVKIIADYMIDRVRDSVNCKCPIPTALSEAEFQRRFVPYSPVALLNLLKGKNQVITDESTCPLSNFARTFHDINFFEFSLPETCSQERLLAGQPCYAQFDMPHYDMTLQVAVDQCPGTYMPFFSITCNGEGCDNFGKPCQTDAECGNHKCHTLHTSTLDQFKMDFFDVLKSMKIYDSYDQYPGCKSTDEWIDGLMKIALRYFTSSTPSTPFSDIRICGFNINNLTTTYADFAPPSCEAQVTTNPDVSCPLTTDYVSVSCSGIRAWDGMITSSSGMTTSATSVERKNGNAFSSKINNAPGDSTSPVVDIFEMGCDSSLSFLGSEKIGFGLKMDFNTIVESVNDLLMSSQECRSSFPLPLAQFRTAFQMWNLDYWGFLFTLRKAGVFTSRSSFLDIFGSERYQKLVMPSTCTFDTYQSTGQCAVKFEGLKDLLMVDATMRAKARRCPNHPNGAPEISIQCEGADCANLFRPKFCNTDMDCSGNLVCQDMTKYIDTPNPIGRILWGIDEDPLSACPNNIPDVIPAQETCLTSQNDWFKSVHNLVQTLTGRPKEDSANAKVCLFDIDSVVNNAQQWSTNMVINSNENYKVRGLMVWDNAYTDGGSTTGTSGDDKVNSGTVLTMSVSTLLLVAAALLVMF